MEGDRMCARQGCERVGLPTIRKRCESCRLEPTAFDGYPPEDEHAEILDSAI